MIVLHVVNAAGLSPRVRGNLCKKLRDLWPEGSIPAGAGEPDCRIHIYLAVWVYPRGCGGTNSRRRNGNSCRGLSPRVRGNLGSRLIDFHSQNKTVAASMIAEKKVSGQRSYRVATRRQSFNRPNMISMRLRRL